MSDTPTDDFIPSPSVKRFIEAVRSDPHFFVEGRDFDEGGRPRAVYVGCHIGDSNASACISTYFIMANRMNPEDLAEAISGELWKRVMAEWKKQNNREDEE